MRLTKTHQLPLFVILLALAAPSLADEQGPVSLDEVRQLRRERKRHAEIVDVIKERGLGFELDNEAQRTLLRLGFRRANIVRLQEISKASSKSPEAPATPPGDVEPELTPQFDPRKQPEYERYAERLEKIRKQSGTVTVVTPSDHVTLVCSQQLAARLMPDVKRLEQLLKKKFPPPLGSGPDRRVANLVLFPTRYEYEQWVRALFQAYADDGINFTGTDPLDSALNTDRFLIDGMFICCLEKMTTMDVRHAVAYGVGFHYVDQITDRKAPAAVTTGFGNVAEVMLLGSPTMMLKSGYAERDIGRGISPWAMIVKQRFLQNKVPAVPDVLEYKTSVMQLPQYAECWSFASLLASGAKEFSSLVLALQRGEPALASIEKIYGLTADKLHARWRQYAMNSR